MPIYSFKRPDGTMLTKRLSFSDYDRVQTGELQVKDDQGTLLELVFDPGNVGFVLKDGVSGGWISKVNKESKYRTARNQVMARREKDHVFKPKLVPNYNGEEAHSWSEVQDHVRTTKGAAAASTYDQLVTKERT